MQSMAYDIKAKKTRKRKSLTMSEKDMQDFLDNEWLPEDAGEYSEGLLKILRRIPDRWGRWISCASGWYPLLVELDEKLAQIEPDYEIHQVKEKFGTLRYYIGTVDSEKFDQMNEIIDSYERKSGITCELCGSEAEMMSIGYWYRTLCPTCAKKDGYCLVTEEEEE
jgi:hypothetical protein